MMKYFVITDCFAAKTCDLSKEQFEHFLNVCKEETKEKEHETMDEWISVYGRSPVRCVEYREGWEKSKTEEQHEDNILIGDLPFQTQYIKIIPASIIKDAPSEFVAKQTAYESARKSGLTTESMKTIERYLQLAEVVRGNFQIANKRSEKQTQKHDSVANRLDALLISNPGLADKSSAQDFADRLKCSKASIIGTSIWKRIMESRKKPKIVSCKDANQIADNRLKVDQN